MNLGSNFIIKFLNNLILLFGIGKYKQFKAALLAISAMILYSASFSYFFRSKILVLFINPSLLTKI